jgi:hypothetical protein
MAVRFQLVIDCADPDLVARFWAAALGYELEPPQLASPAGMTTGVMLESLRPTWESAWTASSIRMAAGRASGSRWCLQRVDAEARRLSDLGATIVGVLSEEGIDHHAVAMKDPEGNEFDIN